MKCLFIGGSQDGHHFGVDVDNALVFWVVTHMGEQREEYRREILVTNKPPHISSCVYVHESIPQFEIIQRLIDGYKPQERGDA